MVFAVSFYIAFRTEFLSMFHQFVDQFSIKNRRTIDTKAVVCVCARVCGTGGGDRRCCQSLDEDTHTHTHTHRRTRTCTRAQTHRHRHAGRTDTNTHAPSRTHKYARTFTHTQTHKRTHLGFLRDLLRFACGLLDDGWTILVRHVQRLRPELSWCACVGVW